MEAFIHNKEIIYLRNSGKYEIQDKAKVKDAAPRERRMKTNN